MNVHWVDWSIILGLMTFVTTMAIISQKYSRSVADFLAANCCAGRYLLGTAQNTALMAIR